MFVKSLLKEGARLLKENKVSSSFIDCELILQHVLKVRKEQLLINYNELVSKNQELLFWQLINQRIKHCPVSQIIKQREFWNLNFIINHHVLDPRPDSETIIEEILKTHQNSLEKLSIADLGTGSGCLLITLLTHFTNSIGVAFENSREAYTIASKNATKHKLKNRIKIFLKSWSYCSGRFDVIVSNPPYIKRADIQKLQPEVRIYEPLQALDGGANGNTCYLEIFKIISRSLKQSGLAVIEIGEAQSNLYKLLPKYGLKLKSYLYDLSNNKRCMVLKKLNKKIDIKSF